MDFDDTYGQIEQLGRLFGTSKVADAAVARLRSRHAAVEKRFNGADKRTAAAIYVSESGLSAYANHSVDHTVIQTLGLSDVFADVAKRNVDINLEELIKRNPDVIIATYGGSGTQIKGGDDAIRALRKIPGVNRLKAIRDGKIIPIHFGYLVGGPLAVEGLEMIADKLAGLKGPHSRGDPHVVGRRRSDLRPLRVAPPADGARVLRRRDDRRSREPPRSSGARGRRQRRRLGRGPG